MAARKSRRPRPKAGSRRIDEKSPPKFDQELLTFLPPPVLDVGEHEYLYHFMLERMQSAVEPKDLIEQIWVRDLVDLTLECFRLRRLRASLLRTNSLKALEKLLETAIEDKEERKDFVDRLSTDDLFVKASTKKILANSGTEFALMNGVALVENLETFERIDHLIMQSEARRNVVLREIDRRRDASARRARETISDIEDAEFADAPPMKPSK